MAETTSADNKRMIAVLTLRSYFSRFVIFRIVRFAIKIQIVLNLHIPNHKSSYLALEIYKPIKARTRQLTFFETDDCRNRSNKSSELGVGQPLRQENENETKKEEETRKLNRVLGILVYGKFVAIKKYFLRDCFQTNC
jgi:hypothetical protein